MRVLVNCKSVLLYNTSGISFVSENKSKTSFKMERLKQLEINYDFDLVCLTEVNKDFRAVHQDNTI